MDRDKIADEIYDAIYENASRNVALAATNSMTKLEAEELVRPYVGKTIEEIGTHIPDKSVYNYNFYRLPNGTVVLLEGNDDCFSQVAVIDGDIDHGNKIWVGGQQDDGYGLMLGEFT